MRKFYQIFNDLIEAKSFFSPPKIGPEIISVANLPFFFSSPQVPWYIVVYSSLECLWLCYVGCHFSMAWWMMPCPRPGFELVKPWATEAEHVNLITQPWGHPQSHFLIYRISFSFAMRPGRPISLGPLVKTILSRAIAEHLWASGMNEKLGYDLQENKTTPTHNTMLF